MAGCELFGPSPDGYPDIVTGVKVVQAVVREHGRSFRHEEPAETRSHPTRLEAKV